MAIRFLEGQKYGGTSMANTEVMRQSGSVVIKSQENGNGIFVVVSAMSGVTTQLGDVMIAAVEPEKAKPGAETDYQKVVKTNAVRHHVLIDENVDPSQADPLHQMVDSWSSEAIGYIDAMVKLRTLSPRYFDWVRALLGEGFVAPIFQKYLWCNGVDTVYYDAALIMVTDGKFGNARPLISSTRERIKYNLAQDLNAGKTVVTGGYYGTGKDGMITTFTRGGGDLTVLSLGHILSRFFNVRGVSLYKADVAGVMSADPKLVNNPHIVPHMIYGEAAALTAIGGSVIHPLAIHHAVRSGSSSRDPFPIYVKSTGHPESAGTVIDHEIRQGDTPIKAISLIRDAIRLTVKGWGMDRPGIMEKITAALAGHGIDIAFISQPHSKLALDLAFQSETSVADFEKGIKEVLGGEMKSNDITTVNAKRVGVIGVIGAGLSDPSNLRKVLDGMDGNFPELKRPDAFKLTTGEYEASILIDLPEERQKELVQSIHDSVFGD